MLAWGVRVPVNFEADMLEMGNRKHGDPFPLPVPPTLHGDARAREAVKSLNKLAGFESKNSQQHFHRPLTSVQQLTVKRISSLLEEAGQCPSDLLPDQALHDLVKAQHLYEGEPSNLVEFDAKKLKILTSSVQPKSLSSLLPPHVLPLFRRRSSAIERTPFEVSEDLAKNPEACPVKPYWDPLLRRDESRCIDLICRLYRVGIIDFRAKIKSTVGLFFVKKKDPAWIRMVIDARIPNFHHRTPPVTRLGGASNFAELDLSQESLRKHFGPKHGDVGYANEMDVSDCFYQFKIPEMTQWFGIDLPKSVRFWSQHGIHLRNIFDDDSGESIQVTDDCCVYPCIGAMAMGWSWALFFANECISHIARMSQPERPFEFREKLPVPQLWSAPSLVSTYVDNIAVIGAHKQDVVDRSLELSRAFEQLDIPVVWTYEEPVRVIETVGIVVDFESKKVRNKQRRLWRVFQASQALSRRCKVRGELVEAWLGHITSLFRLAPHLLSVFNHIYRFVQMARGKRVSLWPSVRAEIVMGGNLVWFASAELVDRSFDSLTWGTRPITATH